MPITVARKICVSSIPLRASYCVGFAALLLAIGSTGLQNATAEGDTRTISLHHMHTDEDLTITYKVDGRYDEEALKKIDYELRDWRRDETIHMDPRLIDLVWEVHRDVGSTEPIQVVCGYRSPETNSMLRQRSSGVAKFSQHMLGKAMDFYLPGVPLEQLRAVGLYLQRGGVGFYPTSGSPFVHLDTGNVRHWPAIAADEMPRLMAEGQSLHAAAENTEVAANHRHPTVVAKLSGARGAPDHDSIPAAASARPAAVITLAAQVGKTSAVPLPQSKPRPQVATYEVASAESRPVQLRPAQAASLVTRAPSANDIISQRITGVTCRVWTRPPCLPPTRRRPTPMFPALRPRSRPPWCSRRLIRRRRRALPETLHPGRYPSEPIRAPPAGWPMRDPAAPVVAQPRPAPMGTSMGRPIAPPDTTVAVKRIGDRPSVISNPAPAAIAATAPPAGAIKTGDHFNDPWLRALIVAPSAQEFMSASSFGSSDYRALAPFMRNRPRP